MVLTLLDSFQVSYMMTLLEFSPKRKPCAYPDILSSASMIFRCSFQVISTWGVQNKIDFLSLSYTRHAEDVRHVRTTPTQYFLLVYLSYVKLSFLSLIRYVELFLHALTLLFCSIHGFLHLLPTLIVCLASILEYATLSNTFLSFLIPFSMDVLAIMQAREFLSKLGDLNQTQIFAKIENIEVLDVYNWLSETVSISVA